MPAGTAASTEALADGLERELDAAVRDRAHVAGCSLGGLLALELAQRGRAHSVVALAPAGDPRRAGRLAARQIELLFMVNRAVGRRLLSHARRVCASARGRRLLFWRVRAHPERVDPTTAANYFHAVMACHTYR